MKFKIKLFCLIPFLIIASCSKKKRGNNFKSRSTASISQQSESINNLTNSILESASPRDFEAQKLLGSSLKKKLEEAECQFEEEEYYPPGSQEPKAHYEINCGKLSSTPPSKLKSLSYLLKSYLEWAENFIKTFPGHNSLDSNGEIDFFSKSARHHFDEIEGFLKDLNKERIQQAKNRGVTESLDNLKRFGCNFKNFQCVDQFPHFDQTKVLKDSFFNISQNTDYLGPQVIFEEGIFRKRYIYYYNHFLFLDSIQKISEKGCSVQISLFSLKIDCSNATTTHQNLIETTQLLKLLLEHTENLYVPFLNHPGFIQEVNREFKIRNYQKKEAIEKYKKEHEELMRSLRPLVGRSYYCKSEYEFEPCLETIQGLNYLLKTNSMARNKLKNQRNSRPNISFGFRENSLDENGNFYLKGIPTVGQLKALIYSKSN